MKLGLLFFIPTLALADCNLQHVSVLAGNWLAQQGEQQISERWLRLSHHSMEGWGQHKNAKGELQSTEELRLVQMQGEVFYLAKVPHNSLPVAFKLTHCEQNHFVFENQAHDFPKKIEYQLQGPKQLLVKVSDGLAEGFSLNFVRQ
ncbi:MULTISPECIES: DUF6265 family protein [Rheinheimera]|uniref:DUF6265 family protein n=1 Tax=Rheinheimera marina TaxID=1774958 RepID=A0ABV9JKB7_9GAMM